MRDETTQTTQTTRSECHWILDDLGSHPESTTVARVLRLLPLRPSLQALRSARFLALSPPSRLIAAGDAP